MNSAESLSKAIRMTFRTSEAFPTKRIAARLTHLTIKTHEQGDRDARE